MFRPADTYIFCDKRGGEVREQISGFAHCRQCLTVACKCWANKVFFGWFDFLCTSEVTQYNDGQCILRVRPGLKSGLPACRYDSIGSEQCVSWKLLYLWHTSSPGLLSEN